MLSTLSGPFTVVHPALSMLSPCGKIVLRLHMFPRSAELLAQKPQEPTVLVSLCGVRIGL